MRLKTSLNVLLGIVLLLALVNHSTAQTARGSGQRITGSGTISLTTSGTSGASTLTGSVLNIPVYTAGSSVSVTAGSSNIVITPSPGTGTFTVDTSTTPSFLSLTTSGLTDNGNAALNGTTTVTNARITGGTINGTTIGATTSATGAFTNLGVRNGFGANIALSISTTTFTPDLQTAQSYLAVLTTACVCAIANPSNIGNVVGQSGMIELDQPLTATTTVTWGSQYKFANGASPILSTTTGAQDYFSYYVKDSTHVIVSGGLLNAK